MYNLYVLTCSDIYKLRLFNVVNKLHKGTLYIFPLVLEERDIVSYIMSLAWYSAS